MTATEYRPAHRDRAVALATVALVAAGAFSAPSAAGADEEPRPKESAALSIEVSDGVDGLAPGDVAEYEVTLRNDGEDEISGVLVSQGVPSQLEIVATDGERVDGEQAQGGLVVWERDMAPGEVVSGRIAARLTGAPGAAWRVVTTACAQTDRSAPPVVCATDADLLPEPAGPAAEAAGAAHAADPGLPLPTRAQAAVAGGGALVLLAGAVLFVLWRRRELRGFDEGW